MVAGPCCLREALRSFDYHRREESLKFFHYSFEPSTPFILEHVLWPRLPQFGLLWSPSGTRSGCLFGSVGIRFAGLMMTLRVCYARRVQAPVAEEIFHQVFLALGSSPLTSFTILLYSSAVWRTVLFPCWRLLWATPFSRRRRASAQIVNLCRSHRCCPSSLTWLRINYY